MLLAVTNGSGVAAVSFIWFVRLLLLQIATLFSSVRSVLLLFHAPGSSCRVEAL
jgi:hypothetical protein